MDHTEGERRKGRIENAHRGKGNGRCRGGVCGGVLARRGREYESRGHNSYSTELASSTGRKNIGKIHSIKRNWAQVNEGEVFAGASRESRGEPMWCAPGYVRGVASGCRGAE